MARDKDFSRSSILRSAKRNFLRYGFEKASMRVIAKEANLTVGAIYKYFKSKSVLFEALVEPTLNGAVELYRKELDLASEKLDSLEKNSGYYLDKDSISGILKMLDYVYAHYDVFDLMFNRSQGTVYENIQEFFVEMEIEGTKKFILALEKRELAKNPFSEAELHIFCTMCMTPLFEVINHKYAYEDAIEMVKIMSYGQHCAWNNICEMRNNKDEVDV